MASLKGALIGLSLLLLSQITFADGEIVRGQVSIAGSSHSADWYLPENPAMGLVYLQHGFSRNSGNLRNLASAMMDADLMVLSVNANMTGGNLSLAESVAEMLAGGQLTPPNGVRLPDSLVLAGHSAGALHAAVAGQGLAAAGFEGLNGVVLFDPVDAGNRMESALQSIVDAGAPVYAILARGGSCNDSNNAQPALQRLTGIDFVGLKLTSQSTHVDPEGENAGQLSRLFCGTPKKYNIEYNQVLGAGWARDLASGSRTADFYPGGAVIEGILSANRGELLK